MPAVFADLTALSNAMSLAGNKANLAMAGIIRTAAYQIQNDAEQRAPKRTGTLASSINVEFNGPLTAVIGPKVSYGVYQEFGTKGPYTIVPRRPGGYLVFEINGQRIFTRKVMHPGLKARPYMRPAAQDIIGGLTKQLGAIGVNMIVEPDRNAS